MDEQSKVFVNDVEVGVKENEGFILFVMERIGDGVGTRCISHCSPAMVVAAEHSLNQLKEQIGIKEPSFEDFLKSLAGEIGVNSPDFDDE